MANEDLRVGDAEREAVAERLRDHFAAGRLTVEEFNERLDAAYAAKTGRDLAGLTRDLPGPPAPPASPQQWAPPHRARHWLPIPARLGLALLAFWVIGGWLWSGGGPWHGGANFADPFWWPGFVLGRILLVLIVVGIVRAAVRRRRWYRGDRPGPGPGVPRRRF